MSLWSKKCFGSVRWELGKKTKATTTCRKGGSIDWELYSDEVVGKRGKLVA